MTGAEIDKRIRQLLKRYPGITARAPRPGLRKGSSLGDGWPDWEFAGSRILYREVKGSGDVLRPDQRRVARAIIHAGGDWQVWGPLDMVTGGRAEQQLAAIAWWGEPP